MSAYRVRRVNLTPGIDDDPVVYATKGQLQVTTGDEFSHRFPEPRIVNGSADLEEIHHGSIVDFAETPITSTSWGKKPMVIRGSCRLIGKPQASLVWRRVTGSCIKRRIIIDTAVDDDIVEFEDLFFRDDGKIEEENNPLITCKRGKIQFRNCYFVNCTQALLVDGSTQTVWAH
eukprot:gene23027-26081_t